MNQRKNTTRWILVLLTAVSAALIISRVPSVGTVWRYGPSLAFDGPKATFYCFRDEWLGRDFASNTTRPGRARLELLNQFAVRPSFNSAPNYLLTAVPGIGRHLASALIAVRQGRHVSPEELQSVSGLGHKRLESLKRAFTFGPPNSPPDPTVLNL